MPEPKAYPPTVWSDAVAPGGMVCAVELHGPSTGICGMPVESEPCREHSLNAYVNGDDGYLWLTCDCCEDPIKQIEAGDALDELVAAAMNHECASAETAAAAEVPATTAQTPTREDRES